MDDLHRAQVFQTRFNTFFTKVTARPGLYTIDTPGELASPLWGYSFALFDEWNTCPLPAVMLEDFSTQWCRELRDQGVAVPKGRSGRWPDWIAGAFPSGHDEAPDTYRARWIGELVLAARRHNAL